MLRSTLKELIINIFLILRSTVGEEHCLLNRVYETSYKKDDYLDWGGHDRLFKKWFIENIVSRAAENSQKVIVTSIGSDPCLMARRYRKVKFSHSIFYVSENFGLFYSHKVNRTKPLKINGYWNDRRSCIDEQYNNLVPPEKILVPGPGDFMYSIRTDTNLSYLQRWIDNTNKLMYTWLDSPHLNLIATTQQIIEIEHPKIIPIPLGVRPNVVAELKKKSTLLLKLMSTQNDNFKKRKRLLLINNSGWRFRTDINAQVIANFNFTLSNLYCINQQRVSCPAPEAYGTNLSFNGVSRLRSKALRESTVQNLLSEPYLFDYIVIGQILQSKFVLCPPGLGYDSYRIWETLYLGAIPIIERSNGKWDSLFHDLPVLFVDDFAQVTPELLQAAYPKIIQRCASFAFNKLTKAYWISFFHLHGVFGGGNSSSLLSK